MEGEGSPIPPENCAHEQVLDSNKKVIDLTDQNIRPTAQSWLDISPPKFDKDKPPAETSLFNEWLGEKGEESVFHDGIYLEDYGCGNGVKAGLIAATLQKHGYPVKSYASIDSERITTEQAEKIARDIVKPGLFRRQKITFHQVVGDFTNPLLNKPVLQDEEQRIRLCLGNTVGNYKPEVVYPALAKNLNDNDLLVIGLLCQNFNLPAELANQAVRDDSPELSQYPEAFRDAIEKRVTNSKKVAYYKEDVFGLDKDHYDFHVSYDHERGWIHEIVVKGIDEESSPDLYSKGLRNGHIIQLSIARVQTVEEHLRDLEKHFTIVDTKRDDKSAHTLFILKKATSNP